jgi:hypothetical protein
MTFATMLGAPFEQTEPDTACRVFRRSQHVGVLARIPGRN